MLLVFALLIAVGLVVFVAAPLLAAEGGGRSLLPVDVTPLGDLKRRRLVVYENLKDLEFEFQAGKVAREDYEELKLNYLAEAAELIGASQDIEQLKESEALIEREVASRRARRKVETPPGYLCPKCGFENPLPVKFCGECGARITASSRK